MRKPSAKAIRNLSKALDVEMHFLEICVDAAAVELYETKGQVDLGNGSALHLRRLQRICITFDVDPHIAMMLAEHRFTRPTG